MPSPLASQVAVALLLGGRSGLLSNPWFYAVVSAASLIVAATVGAIFDPSRTFLAESLAMGGGALITAMSYELFARAYDIAGARVAAGFLLAGVVTFGGLDVVLDRVIHRKDQQRGWGLMASVATDGIPENAALGVVLLGKSHGGMAFLVALMLTNEPQALTGGLNMAENHSQWVTIGAWTVVGLLLAASIVVGYRYLGGLSKWWLAAIRAFAGSAILASLADEIFPDAYDEGGPTIAFATAAGFLLTFLLK